MTVRFAQIATFIWLGLICVLLLSRAKEAYELSLPNWGDFFAGFAAPLAFLWLVVATFIQRNELRAQIKELSASRMALEAQIAEQKATASALSLQHGIMQQEWEENKKIILNTSNITYICNEIYNFYSDKDVFILQSTYRKYPDYGPSQNLLYMHDYYKIKSDSDVIQFLRGAIDHASGFNYFLNDEENQFDFIDPDLKSMKLIRELLDFYRNIRRYSEENRINHIKIHVEKLLNKYEMIDKSLHSIKNNNSFIEDPQS